MSDELKIIRCPHCNGEISSQDIHNGKVKCPWCMRESFVKYNNSDISKAIEYRNELEFEKAIDILSSLLGKDPSNPEIYWQMLLCDYGVSFGTECGDIIKDPSLIHLQTTSIFENPWYKQMVDAFAKAKQENIYVNAAQQIEDIRLKSYEVIKKEKPYDVFICFKKTPDSGEGNTKDYEYAKELYKKLTDLNLKVFFSDVTLRQFPGDPYEPHIFSALMTAKVFLLVAGNSSEGIQYPFSPWVKNEWLRFINRTEHENGLNFTPCLIDSTFNPNKLPPQIYKKMFQCIYFGKSDFDDSLYSIIKRYVTNSNISIIEKNAEMSKVVSLESSINFKEGKTYKPVDLTNDESVKMSLVLLDMATNTPKSYQLAAAKLDEILSTNERNCEANWNRILCLFKTNSYSELTQKSLNDLNKNDFKIFNECLNRTFATADEEFDHYFSVIKDLFVNNMNKGNLQSFINFLDTDHDIFNTTAKFLSNDLGKLYELTDSLKNELIKYLLANITASNLSKSEVIIEKLLKPVYALQGTKGTIKLCKLYDDIAFCLRTHSRYDEAKYWYSKSLKFYAADYNAIWNMFLCEIKCCDDNKAYLNIDKKNFKIFDPTIPNEKEENNFSNLYAILVKLYKLNYEINDYDSNYFVIAKNIASLLLSDKKTNLSFSIVKELYKLFLAKTTDENLDNEREQIANNLYLRYADSLIVCKEFKKAKELLETLLTKNPNLVEAYWGLLKCDLKIRTNYGLIFYKGRITENKFYKQSFAASKKINPDNESISEYALLITSIKTRKRKDRKLIYCNFRRCERSDILRMKSTPIKEIVQQVKSNRVKPFQNPTVYDTKTNPTNKNIHLPLKFFPSIFVILSTLIPLGIVSYNNLILIVLTVILLLSIFILFKANNKLSDYGADFRQILYIPLSIIFIAFSALIISSGYKLMPEFLSKYLYYNNLVFEPDNIHEDWSSQLIFISIIVSTLLSFVLCLIYCLKNRKNLVGITQPFIGMIGILVYETILDTGALFLYKEDQKNPLSNWIYVWIVLCLAVQTLVIILSNKLMKEGAEK